MNRIAKELEAIASMLEGKTASDDMERFGMHFAAWFTGTSLYQLNHPIYGRHQLSSKQVLQSGNAFRRKLWENIKKAWADGDIDNALIRKHNRPY